MVAGAFGAAARYALDGFVSDRIGSSFPWGTLVINVSGSLLLGILYTVLTNRIAIDSALRLAVTVGFLGSYTTFSTLTLETARLFQERSYALAAVNSFGSLLLGLTAVGIGIVVGNGL